MIANTLPFLPNGTSIKIEYKKIKGIIVRINPLGELIIRANKRFTVTEIYNYLASKEKWLTKNLTTINTHINELFIYDCINHNKMWLFDKLYDLQFSEQPNTQVSITNSTIIFSKSALTNNKYLKIIRTRFQTEIKNIYNNITKRYYPNKHPKLKFKDYKSRWGVYYPNKNEIILNERLCHLPESLVRLIIHHELVHTKIKNHSRAFYNELEKYEPNYLELTRQLHKYTYCLMKEY